MIGLKKCSLILFFIFSFGVDCPIFYSFLQVGDHPVRSMVLVNGFVWCACKWNIHVFDGISLKPQGAWVASSLENRQIDCLRVSPDGQVVWSNVYEHWIVSGWDAESRKEHCRIDTTEAIGHILRTTQVARINEPIVTVMDTSEDTLWLGLATGHLLVYDQDGEFSAAESHSGFNQLMRPHLLFTV